MTAVVHGGPHGRTETGGAYTEAAALLNDEFDTSGTDIEFCEFCEHAPCVAGGRRWCGHSPRFITVEAVRDEIDNLQWQVTNNGNPLWKPLRRAVLYLGDQAWARGYEGDRALRGLALIRDELRKAKEAQA